METTSQTCPNKVTDLPLVSVLIASYRSGALLYEAVNSVLSQDYPRLELIICDDGSEDFDEGALCALWESGSIPVRVIHQTVNVGTVKNLNAGLRQAKGTYLLFFAADDLLASPTTVGKLVRCTQRSGSPWVLGHTQVCDAALHPTGEILPTTAQEDLLKDGSTLYPALCLDCFVPASGNLYARPLLDEIGLLDERCRLVEDWPLMLKLARAGYTPTLAEGVSVKRRCGGVSNHHVGKNKAYQTDLIAVMQQEILPHLDGLTPSVQKKIRRQCADKEEIYKVRFACEGNLQKFCWAIRHLSLLWRKLTAYGA